MEKPPSNGVARPSTVVTRVRHAPESGLAGVSYGTTRCISRKLGEVPHATSTNLVSVSPESTIHVTARDHAWPQVGHEQNRSRSECLAKR